MLREVLEGLRPGPGAVVVDCTFGRGGHALALLRRVQPGGRVIGLDRDPEAVAAGSRLALAHQGLQVVHAPFGALAAVVQEQGVLGQVNAVLIDLGVSSPQLDAPERGFSIRHDGPLDMRMDPGHGESAAQWLAAVDERDLARVLRTLGEERAAPRIARAIVRARAKGAIGTTRQLAEVVAAAVPGGARRRHHPATRCFQAIRMHVNRELEELESALPQTLRVLAPGGRLAVISFHSLEDRIVKRFMRDPLGRGPQPRHLPVPARLDAPPLRPVAGLQRPGDEEVQVNVRARSARLRVAERCAP
jgi:16S rRNA (cytosine1402-N4)-methyltransferase